MAPPTAGNWADTDIFSFQPQNKKNKISSKNTSKLERYERKINRAKIKGRSDLDLFEWSKWDYWLNDYWISEDVDTVPRIDYDVVSKEEFIRGFEAPGLPVVIRGADREWPAAKLWDRECLLKMYGSQTFKIDEDEDGNNVYIKLKHYFHYLDTQATKDDSPLYIFDSGFDDQLRNKKYKQQSPSENKIENENFIPRGNNPLKRSSPLDLDKDTPKKAKTLSKSKLLEDYEVPVYFTDDLFHLAGERRRPPYRWFVLGPSRSGTGIHVDPLGTSAWNSLLVGHKRWCLFPPSTNSAFIDPPMKPYDREAVSWFTHVFPRFTKTAVDQNDCLLQQTVGERLGMVQILQKPGETVFVPGGWHHVVMNLDFTIAVTQNFCSPTNLESVWLRTRNSRPKLAQKFLYQLRLRAENNAFYTDMIQKIDSLRFTPSVPPSSESSSSSSSSSSSNEGEERLKSFTESESDLSDGTCMCRKCKMRRKK